MASLISIQRCIYSSDSCTHTDKGDHNPWWKAKLEQKSAVSKVVVYPRMDDRKDAIDDVKVNTKSTVTLAADSKQPPVLL